MALKTASHYTALMGRAEYSRYRRWSPAYTSKLIREDKLVLRNGKMDVAASDQRLKDTRPGMRSVSEEQRATQDEAKEQLGEICGRLIHWATIASLLASTDAKLEEAEGWLRQGIENCLTELNDR